MTDHLPVEGQPGDRWHALIPSLAAFIGYGGWAWLANSAHGPAAAWRALLTQGSYSFAVTLGMTLLLEYLFRRSQSVMVATGAVCVLLYATSWSVNWLAGTPEILLTIVPGAVIGTIYSALWCLRLARRSG